MSDIKVKRRSGYSTIPNAMISDKSLSIEARGLLALLMSMSENWVFRTENLIEQCGVGRQKYQRMVREIKAAGYLSIADVRDDGGRISYEWEIMDAPRVDFPTTAEPTTGNQPPIRENKEVKSKEVKSKEVTPLPPKIDIVEIKEALNAYNIFAEAEGWPKAQALTKQRKAKIVARLKDAGGIEGWRTALEKAKASDFLSGRKTDFMVSLDFILQASSFTKLMEGNYDNRTGNNSGLRPSDDPTLRAIFDAATDVAARGMDRN